MDDYIKRDHVINALNKLCDRVCQYSKAQRKVMCGACPLGDAFTVIEDDIPAADVRENVRGRWLHKQNYEGEWICSLCTADLAFVYGRESGLPNFCPNCGADMRKEEKNNAAY